MEKEANEIILAFIGEPSSPTCPVTSTCHGYDAFVCSKHTEIYTLFKSLSLWCGPTQRYEKNGDVYLYYELDCRDRDFFKSAIFKRICSPYNVKITICEDSKELYELFYKDAKML